MKDFTTYLIFDGNCREAMQFYKKCLGAELEIMAFSEARCEMPADARDRTMHARLTKGNRAIMASDNMPGMPFAVGNNFSISIECESAEETDSLFNALVEKGQVTMALQKTFWATRFGMLTDQFGVNWMFNFSDSKSA